MQDLVKRVLNYDLRMAKSEDLKRSGTNQIWGSHLKTIVIIILRKGKVKNRNFNFTFGSLERVRTKFSVILIFLK